MFAPSAFRTQAAGCQTERAGGAHTKSQKCKIWTQSSKFAKYSNHSSCSHSVRSPPIFPEVLGQRRLPAKIEFNAIRPLQKSDAKNCCYSALQLWTVTASLSKVRVRNWWEEVTVWECCNFFLLCRAVSWFWSVTDHKLPSLRTLISALHGKTSREPDEFL